MRMFRRLLLHIQKYELQYTCLSTGFCTGSAFYILADEVGYIASVNGASMQPTLNPEKQKSRDFVFYSRWAAKDYKFKRGDIVTFMSPYDKDKKFIKRIIGLEGDVIKTLSWRKRYLKIPPGHCWVEGDNHERSMDSNAFGPIPLGLILSKAKCIIWPPERYRTLDGDDCQSWSPRINPIDGHLMLDNKEEDLEEEEWIES